MKVKVRLKVKPVYKDKKIYSWMFTEDAFKPNICFINDYLSAMHSIVINFNRFEIPFDNSIFNHCAVSKKEPSRFVKIELCDGETISLPIGHSPGEYIQKEELSEDHQHCTITFEKNQ